MILLDTSVLIGTLTANRSSLPQLRAILASGEPVKLSTLVLYEWLRGPRTTEEIGDQEDLFPARAAIKFGPEEAALSAQLYRTARGARSREIDIAIAACAIHHNAQLWTLNPTDFTDIPGLQVFLGQK